MKFYMSVMAGSFWEEMEIEKGELGWLDHYGSYDDNCLPRALMNMSS